MVTDMELQFFQGIQWVKFAFDAAGRYTRFNEELPTTLPQRRAGFQEYVADTPITEHGYSLAVKCGNLSFRISSI